MSLIYLVVYILILSFIFSAISGIVMFFVDMIRFGSPHKRFETVSSIEKYNERLSKIENDIDAAAADQSDSLAENFKIDL